MDTGRGLQEQQRLKSPQLPTVRSSHSHVTRPKQDRLIVEHQELETSADLLPCTEAENQISGDRQLSRTGGCHQHRVQDSAGVADPSTGLQGQQLCFLSYPSQVPSSHIKLSLGQREGSPETPLPWGQGDAQQV